MCVMTQSQVYKSSSVTWSGEQEGVCEPAVHAMYVSGSENNSHV